MSAPTFLQGLCLACHSADLSLVMLLLRQPTMRRSKPGDRYSPDGDDRDTRGFVRHLATGLEQSGRLVGDTRTLRRSI